MSVYKGQEKVLNSITAVEEAKVKQIAKEEAKEVYCTNETVIGTWIDGKQLYRKTVNFGALPNNTTKTVPHNITDLDYVVSIRGVAVNGSTRIILPHVSPSTPVQLYIDGDNIAVTAGAGNFSVYSVSHVVVEYTKTNS